MRSDFFRPLACACLAGAAPLAHAAGFALIEQNASGLGHAYAGQAAAAEDASTLFFNPAGMTRLPDRQAVAAGHLIVPRAKFSGTVTPNIGGGNGGDAGTPAFVPNTYYVHRLSPDIHAGVGIVVPFGLTTEYDKTWKGRVHAIESGVRTVNVNPALAFRLSDTVSLGMGVSLQYIQATLSSAAGAGLPPPVGKIEGDDFGWGMNAGLLWQATAATRVGVSYRSEIEHRLRGDFKVNGTLLAKPVFASVTLPDSASLAVVHDIDSRLTLLADITWTGWSDFERLAIVNGAGADVVPPVPENWRDTMRYAVGVAWRVDDRLKLRTGVAFDESAVRNPQLRTARIPDEDRTWVALGAQYRLSPQSVIEVGYTHIFVKDARIDETRSGLRLEGVYKGAVDILSAQLTYTF